MATAMDERVKEILMDMVRFCKAIQKPDQPDEQILILINETIKKFAEHKNAFRIANKGPSLAKLIAEANKHTRLTDDQIKDLRSGFDAWSNLSLDEVLRSMKHDVVSTIQIALDEAFATDIKSKARAARWIGRGLKINHAIAKVKFENDLYGR